MTQQYINFKRERRFGDKINATFAFTSQNLKPLAKSALFIAGPFALLSYIVLQVYQYNTMGNLTAGFGSSAAAGPGDAFASTAWYSYLGITYLFLFVMIALTIAIAQRHIRAYVDTGSADIEPGYLIRTIWRDLLSAMGSLLGISVLLTISGIVIIMPFALAITAFQTPVIAFVMLLALFIGSLLIFSALMLIHPIRNFEKINFFEAIGRIFAINTGKWWSTAGIMFVTFLILLVLNIALYLPTNAVVLFQYFHTGSTEEMLALSSEISVFTILSVIGAAIFNIGSTLIGSIAIIAITFQYFSLREIREANGLLERMQSFGVAPTVNEEEEQY